MYFFLTLIFVIPFAVILLAGPQGASGLGSLGSSSGTGLAAPFLLVVPFVYAIVGWAFTALFCLLYNLAARFTGGIAVQVTREIPPPVAPAVQGWGQPQP